MPRRFKDKVEFYDNIPVSSNLDSSERQRFIFYYVVLCDSPPDSYVVSFGTSLNPDYVYSMVITIYRGRNKIQGAPL